MATRTTIELNGVSYPIVVDKNGAMQLVRKLRPSQSGDPGITRHAVWKIGSPVGQSRERADGFLGTDYCRNLDTSFSGDGLDDLLTSAPARVAITLTSQDPANAANAAKFGGPKFGAAGTKFGGAFTAQNVTGIVEDRSYLFFDRGVMCTQVDPSNSYAVVAATQFDAQIRGSAVWKGTGKLGLGSTVTMRKRTNVTSAGATYTEALAGTYAGPLAVGKNKLWFRDDDPTNVTKNYVKYTADDVVSVSGALAIGDTGYQVNGLTRSGENMVAGSEVGAFSFDDLGQPVSIVESLAGSRSVYNGLPGQSVWGWTYLPTVRGLYATKPAYGVANPVGIGSDAMRNFEGHDGYPTAVFAWGESLFVAYKTSAGDTYIYRGLFNPDRTPATGQPDFFPFRYLASTHVGAISASSVSTNPNIVWGEGTNAARAVMGRGGFRADLDANYVYSTDGGVWYGSTMMRSPGLHKFLRYFTFLTENASASNTWALAVSADEGSYVTLGTVTTNGHQVLRPVSGGIPLSTVTFHNIKPRLTQVAASSSAPPRIRGLLSMAYDERPETVEEFAVTVEIGQHGNTNETDITNLETLGDHSTGTPVKVRFPSANPQDSDRYGFVTGVQIDPAKGDGLTVASIRGVMWDVA